MIGNRDNKGTEVKRRGSGRNVRHLDDRQERKRSDRRKELIEREEDNGGQREKEINLLSRGR